MIIKSIRCNSYSRAKLLNPFHITRWLEIEIQKADAHLYTFCCSICKIFTVDGSIGADLCTQCIICLKRAQKDE
jgi:hypothetical protein